MADPKSIHEFLPTSGNIGSLFLVDDPDSQATSGYTTRQISMDDVGEMVNNGIDYTQDLDTENKKIIGALNELHGVDGYDVYDNTATYAVGDICIHSNSLQVCTTAVTVAEDFDSNKWSPTTIKALLALKQNITDTTLTTDNKQIVPAINELNSGKQSLIKSVSRSITPSASSSVSPFSFYGEYNFSSDIGDKTVLSVVIEGGGSNNAHTYSFVSKRIRIYANANDALTVTLFLI